MRRLDLAQQKYGKLTAIRYDHTRSNGNAVWLCKCDCGNGKMIDCQHLKRQTIKSCGCIPNHNMKDISII